MKLKVNRCQTHQSVYIAGKPLDSFREGMSEIPLLGLWADMQRCVIVVEAVAPGGDVDVVVIPFANVQFFKPVEVDTEAWFNEGDKVTIDFEDPGLDELLSNEKAMGAKPDEPKQAKPAREQKRSARGRAKPAEEKLKLESFSEPPAP